MPIKNEVSNSSLQISELWEYATVYKAEPSDTNRAKALDLSADKFTCVIRPEMGISRRIDESLDRRPCFSGICYWIESVQISIVDRISKHHPSIGYRTHNA
jgi:hypothetical protein